jgi:CBS domain-containing protein
LSARAAARLEYLGFRKVYRYTAGKADWLAAGRPIEGQKAQRPTVRDAARNIPTCSPDERIARVKQRLDQQLVCAVVDSNNVVLGLLDPDAWTSDADAPAKDVMTLAPLTFRPDRPIRYAKEYLEKHEIDKTLVTTSDGQLIGLAVRADVDELARKS